MRISLLILVMLVALPSIAAAQSKVTATVRTTTVMENETVSLTIEVKNAEIEDVELLDEPRTVNLAPIVSRPSISRSVDIVDGRLAQSVRIRYTYRPVGTGPASIGAVRVRAGEDIHETEIIRITVLSTAALAERGREEPGAVPLGQDDVFIHASVNADTVYVNQQLIVEYRLFFRDGVHLRQSRLAGSWDTPGFWREEMEVDLRPRPDRRVVNGVPYQTILLKRVALYPTRDGRLRIEPLRIESEVRPRAGNPRDPFYAYRSRFRSMDVTSNALDVDVRRLPAGAPDSFTGAVGNYAFSRQHTATTLQTGDPLNITFDIEGRGNFAMIDAPEIQLPAPFDSFSPRVATEVDFSSVVPSGRKSFSITAVPNSPGEYVIPAVPFSYFDPYDHTYRTLETDSIVLRVEGSPLVAEVATSETAPILVSNWSERPSRALYQEPWAYAPLAVPLAAFLLLPGVRRIRKHREESRIRAERDATLNASIEEIRRIGRQRPDQALALLPAFLKSQPDIIMPPDVRTELLARTESAGYAPPVARRSMAESILKDVHIALLASEESA
jgi:hypothetical protein